MAFPISWMLDDIFDRLITHALGELFCDAAQAKPRN